MVRRPVRRFRPDPGAPAADRARGGTAATEALELPAGATVLVGENGSGTSTVLEVLEVLAAALGLDAEGGSVAARHETRRSEPGSLHLIVGRSPGADRWAYFLRDETLHGLYSYLEAHQNPHVPEPLFHEFSHGEAFLALLQDLVAGGAQQKDPVLPALCRLRAVPWTGPGPWGMRAANWESLELTASWRQFLRDPQSFLRYLG